MKSVVSCWLVALVLGLPSFAADWAQFQGPGRDGRSPETGLARSWPEDGPKELWSVDVGGGYGGAAVCDGEVFFLDREEEQRDILRCLDLNTGAEKWRYAYDAPGSAGHSGSRTAPTVDADCVYTVGLMGDFLCIDRKTHQPVWHKNIVKDFGVDMPKWGTAQSPSLYQNLVIVAPQAEDAFVVAFERATGARVWASPGFGGLGYSTPHIAMLCGVDQALMISASEKAGKSQVVGLSMEDGRILWRYAGWQSHIPIPYPMPLSEDRLFVTGGYRAGSVMLKVSKEGEAFAVEELFKLGMEECGSQIHQPLLYEDHLYLNSNSNEREDGMTCLTLDGKVLWQTKKGEDLPTFERGNLLLADGMIIVLDGKRCTLHLVAPSPEGYKELAQARPLRGGRSWAPMALSQGKLVLRNQREMICLDLGK